MGATWHFLSWLSWSRRTPNASIGALKRSGSELSFLNANDTEEPHEDGDGFGGSALVSKTGGEGDDTMPEITPLPWRSVITIGLSMGSQAFQVTMLFPMLVFMVDDYGIAGKNEDLVGQFAGILASCFPFAQFMSSYLWGVTSDRIGRRPVIVFGNIAAAAAALLLGFSRHFLLACVARLLGGLLNGTLGSLRTSLGELCDSTNQASGFAIFQLAWGLGSIIGPVVGGLFARPCDTWNLGDTCPVLLRRYPYLLPCALGSAVSLFASAMSAYFLEETLHRVKPTPRRLRKAGYEAVGEVELEGVPKGSAQGDLPEGSSRGKKLQPEVIHMGPEHSRHGGSVNGGTAFAQLMQMRAQSITAKASRTPSVNSKGALPLSKQQDLSRDPPNFAEPSAEARRTSRFSPELLEPNQVTPGASMHGASLDGVKRRAELTKGDAEGAVDFSSGSLHGASAYGSITRRISSGDRRQSGLSKSPPTAEKRPMQPQTGELPTRQVAGYQVLGRADDGDQGDRSETAPGAGKRAWWKDRDILVACGSYGMLALVFIILDELLPIFAATPLALGGLGLSSEAIGTTVSVGGVTMFLFTMFVFAPLSKRFGPILCYRYGTLVMVPICLIAPAMSLLVRETFARYLGLMAILVVRNIASTTAFTGVLLIVSNSSPPEDAGKVNGLGQTTASFARALGPAFGGSLWSFSETLRFPYHQFLAFVLTAIFALLTYVSSLVLSEQLNVPRAERGRKRVAQKVVC